MIPLNYFSDNSFFYSLILNLILWLPVIFISIILFIKNKKIYKYLALSSILLQLFSFCLALFLKNSSTNENIPHILIDLGNNTKLCISYFISLDKLNVYFVALCILIFLVVILTSWNIQEKIKSYFILLLLSNTLIIGAFLAQDIILFYLFFEMALLPMFFFISLWGKKEKSATLFFIYTLIGAILILISIIVICLSISDPKYNSIVYSSNINQLLDKNNYLPNSIFNVENMQTLFGISLRKIIFLCMLFGFLIKFAIVPFHSWLPKAHADAPTPISIILSALMLKLGGYGFLKFIIHLFPQELIYYSTLIAILAIISIFYSALNAFAAQDLKLMIAYSSIVHMGFVLLGIASCNNEGISGALYQMISHGIISAILFLLVEALQKRNLSTTISNHKGLLKTMPIYSIICILSLFIALGLPGFSSFMGEILILLGVFQSTLLSKYFAIIASFGIFFNALYCINTIQKMFLGSSNLNAEKNSYSIDLHAKEYIILFSLIFISLLLGVFPNIILSAA